MGAMEPSLLKLLHEINLHLEGLHSVLGEDKTAYMLTINSIQDKQDSPKVVTSMIQVFYITVYVSLDLGASLYFITAYVCINFDVFHEKISVLLSICTLIGDSILVERVYCDCPNSVNHKNTMADLIEIGIDMIYACYASVDCRT